MALPDPTTTETLSLTLTQGIGYRGRTGERAWVAEITGTGTSPPLTGGEALRRRTTYPHDRVYGLDRTFVDADSITRDNFGRPRYTRSYHYELPPGGMYEGSLLGPHHEVPSVAVLGRRRNTERK